MFLMSISQSASWRLMNSDGSMRELTDSDLEKLKKQFYTYDMCEKHRTVYRGKRARRLHLEQEHAY